MLVLLFFCSGWMLADWSVVFVLWCSVIAVYFGGSCGFLCGLLFTLFWLGFGLQCGFLLVGCLWLVVACCLFVFWLGLCFSLG